MATLKCTCYISIDDAEPVEFGELTEEQTQRCKKIWAERLSRVSSAYFTNHPQEYAAL